MEMGELPNDMAMIGAMVERIAYKNAERFFGLQL
jgi:hypothetical protein